MTQNQMVKMLNKVGIARSLKGDHDEAMIALATTYYKKGMLSHAVEEFYTYLCLSPTVADYDCTIDKIGKLTNRILAKEKISVGE